MKANYQVISITLIITVFILLFALSTLGKDIFPPDMKDDIVIDRHILLLNKKPFYATISFHNNNVFLFILYRSDDYDNGNSIEENWERICEYKWDIKRNEGIKVLDANIEEDGNVIYYNIIEDSLYVEATKSIMYNIKMGKCSIVEDIN